MSFEPFATTVWTTRKDYAGLFLLLNSLRLCMKYLQGYYLLSICSDGWLGLGNLHSAGSAHCCGMLPWERVGGVCGGCWYPRLPPGADFLLLGVLGCCWLFGGCSCRASSCTAGWLGEFDLSPVLVPQLRHTCADRGLRPLTAGYCHWPIPAAAHAFQVKATSVSQLYKNCRNNFLIVSFYFFSLFSDTKPSSLRGAHCWLCPSVGYFLFYWDSPLCLDGTISLPLAIIPPTHLLPCLALPNAPSCQLSHCPLWFISTFSDVSWPLYWSWHFCTSSSSGACTNVWRTAALKHRPCCSGRRSWPAHLLWFSHYLHSAGSLCTSWTVFCSSGDLKQWPREHFIQVGQSCFIYSLHRC